MHVFEVKPPEAATPHPAAHRDTILMVEEHEERHTLRAVNPRKAAGPDGVCRRVLKDCANQLVGVFIKIFRQDGTVDWESD